MSLTDVLALPNDVLELAVEITMHDNATAVAKADLRADAERNRRELKAHAARH